MITPVISIITTAFNSESTIERCIESLKSQSYPKEKFEIIVVDDESIDKTIELAKKAGADQVISSEHTGSPGSLNLGVKNARGSLYAFIDSDCEAKEGWLMTISKELEKLDAITGPIENGNTHSPVSWAEYLLNFIGRNEFVPRTKTSFLTGCNQACTKEAYEKAGGFKLVKSGYDVYFGDSLRNAGYDCYFIPEMKIRHIGLTDKIKLYSKMKRRGAGFIRQRREIKNMPHSFLAKNRIFIPLVFCRQIFVCFIYSVKAKKIGKFFTSFSIIIRTVLSFCSGAWEEYGHPNSQV